MARVLTALLCVVLPLGAILFELHEGLCARHFLRVVQPWPLAVFALMVPLIGVLDLARRSTPFLWGIAAGVSAVYGLLFTPLLPLAIVAIVAHGLGLFGLIPIAAMVVSFRRARSAAAGSEAALHSMRRGAMASALLFLLASLPNVATGVGLRVFASGGGSGILRAVGNREAILSAGCPGGASIADVWLVPVPQSQQSARAAYEAVIGRDFESDARLAAADCLDSTGTVVSPEN